VKPKGGSDAGSELDQQASGAMRTFVAEEMFRLLVESIRDYAIFMLDPEGRVTSWNAGAATMKGYSAEEIIGRELSVFYSAEDRAKQKPETLLALAATLGRVEDEGWRIRKDGERFWADVLITPLRDPSGKLLGFAKVTRDLSRRREMEQKLREAEERLSATLYSIGDGVLATDQSGRIRMINPVAERLTGWSEAEAIGQPIDHVFSIINEHTRAPAISPVTRVLAEGIVVGLANHTALISRDGTERPIADSGAPIRDLQGAVQGCVLVFRDVTEERRAEEALRQSEERLRLMIASVQDYAIFMLDPEGRVMSWNPGAEKINGYREEEIIGQHFSRFFTREDVDAGRPLREIETATRIGRFEEEGWRVRKDGSPFWANVVITAVRDSRGDLVGFTKVTRDLTERRKRQEEQVQLARVTEALRLRDEFLSIASHELRTPLSALQLYLDTMLNGVASDEDRLRKKVEKAKRSSERLADLVDALLDASRISSGKIELAKEPCDLADTARDVIERLREAAEVARCTLTLDAAEPVIAVCDRLRIEQVLMNLVANAFRHAPRSSVDLRVAREGDFALIEVLDTGPGLPEAALDRIFDRFERASPIERGGLGLGLYVARQIIEAHGGTISAANAPKGGAVFTTRLPLASREGVREPAPK
jgi:PAS domain S-box-containing protein